MRVDVRSVVRWLRFAAAPTFAVMAVICRFDDGGARLLCAAAPDASPFGGMAWMYLLMSVFHAPPWLDALFGPPRPTPSAGSRSPAAAAPASCARAAGRATG